LKIADNVALLPVPWQSTVNFVLTWDENNLVLIDAGFPGQTDAIVKAISDEGFDVTNLTYLIITHQDWDHIGCVMDLQKLVPDLKVLAHEEEAPYIDGRKTPIKLAARLAEYDTLSTEMRGRCDWQKDYYASNEITIHETLSDGEILPICGGIEVIHTPGHTPGHIVLHLQDSDILVCGDACNIKDGQLIGANPVHTFDVVQADASLTKIKSRNPSGIVAYHGGYLKLSKDEGCNIMFSEYSMIISTFAYMESAKKTAKMLLERRLAACVQMFPIESMYIWKNEIHDESETILFIKSRTDLFDEIAASIRKIHPYEVPEIIQIPISEGLPEYLTWLGSCVKNPQDET